MWFFCHSLFWGTQYEVLLASPLCCGNNNLGTRCLPRHMPTMPCVIHRWVFFFRAEPPNNSYVFVGVCYCVCFLLSGSHVDVIFTNSTSNHWVCNSTTLQSIPLADKCTSQWWSVVHARSALSGCSSQCFELGELHATPSTVPQPLHQYGGAYSCGGSAESHLIPPPFVHGRNRSSFPGDIPLDVMSYFKSVRGIKFWCGGWVSGWWIYSQLVVRVLHYLTTHFPWFHRQAVNINPLSTWTRM